MREKLLPHCLQLYFLTSECVCRCARRFERSANARPQNSQRNGFSPVTSREYTTVLT